MAFDATHISYVQQLRLQLISRGRAKPFLLVGGMEESLAAPPPSSDSTSGNGDVQRHACELEHVSSAIRPPQSADLPDGAVGLKLDYITILLSPVPDAEDEEFPQFLEKVLWWVANVHKQLKNDVARADLLLCLVFPPSKTPNAATIQACQQLDSDEQFCRKMTWIPDSGLENGGVSAFLDRTMLATPWLGDDVEVNDVWPLAQSLQRLVEDGLLTPQEKEAWAEVLESSQQRAEHLARTLVENLEDVKIVE